MHRRQYYPVRTDLKTTLYTLYMRFLKLAPTGMLLTMLLLLVGFSAATGYLVMERKAQPSAAASSVSPSQVAESNPSQPATVQATLSLSGDPALLGNQKSAENAMRHFAIALGAYVYRTTFENERQMADRLEQPFHIKIGERRVTMTRLHLGTYPAKKAAALLKKAQAVAPDAFLVPQGKLASVYGGSFYYRADIEKRQALLASKGFTAKQVPTRETMPIYSLYMGDFDSEDKAMEFIRTAGLPEKNLPVVAIN